MAYDLAYFDREISKRTQEVLELKDEIDGYNRTIQICKDEKVGLFSVYSCKRNTGETMDDWRAIRDRVKTTLANTEAEITRLKKERAYAVTAIASSSQVMTQQAKQEIVESVASGEAAKKYGLWAAVIGVAGIFGYLAVKKIRS